MSRHDESIGRMPNPSQFFLEWNSELKSFCYYSSEKAERIPFDLPFRFLALKFMNCVSGYDDQRGLRVYSNEVSDTRKEHFRVSYSDGSNIATGIYSDIKDDVNACGGRFTRSIYAITQKGAIINIRLRGGQMINFGAIEKFGNRWQDEWIQVSTYETRTHGEDKQYTVPVFGFGGTVSATDSLKADNAYKLVKAYFQSKPAGSTTSTAPAQRPFQQSTPAAAAPTIFASDGDDDDLPF